MRIYLAAAFGRQKEMQTVAKRLEAVGHTVTSRWLHADNEDDGVACPLEQIARRVALTDLEDLGGSECLVSFTDGAKARGGRHVQFGFGLAKRLRLIVVGPKEHVFHTLRGVEHLDSVDELIACLDATQEEDLPRW